MANTLIQIKRSTVNSQPSGGSLSSAEPAYSYVSNTLFLGTSDGTGVFPIGGFAYITKANDSYTISTAAYDKANAANVLAYNNGIGGNTGIGANAFAAATIAGANTAVGSGANAFTSATIAGANTAVGTGANTYANATFLKLTAPNQTITGNVSIVGSLTLTGNTIFANVETFRISDPLLYLAGNNYTSDIVDIGFIANYVNATGSNVHTGLYREHTSKEYYLFKEYAEEPENNHIDPTANGFALSVLNADIRTSNLNLTGVNAAIWITSAFNKANNANVLAYETGIGANTYLLSVISGANTAVGTGANAYADLVGSAANTNAANASYLSIGTVPSARISGSYTGITAVGTLTAGVWNGSTITVPYGGTGATSFTANGIIFGNVTGALQVTAQGSDGNILQTDANGRPFFGFLDGGMF